MEQQPFPVTRRSLKKQTPSLTRIIFTFLWAAFLLLSTWTKSLERFLDFQSIGFQWNWHPNVAAFFYFGDLTLIHPDYTVVKLGHFTGFAILDVLLFGLFRTHRRAMALSLSYAFLTEFFQLFLGRDGRLYDFGIDAAGVLTVYVLMKMRKLLWD